MGLHFSHFSWNSVYKALSIILFHIMSGPQEASGHKKSEKKSENKKKEKGSKTSAPVMNGTDVAKPAASPEQVEKLKGEIAVQGDKVRNLKTSGAAKVGSFYRYIPTCMRSMSCSE